ncbi:MULTISPECIES: hypothetical protein [Priestia]|uniref:hypothetical protein n=1 Tax=Priestia TaxID=2800373 RepID=UPI000BF147B4|nr:hypothetical protein [Priestia aryabhattai]PEI55963.1 hypothetical protein CN635_16710 [Priestia aryabhattai]
MFFSNSTIIVRINNLDSKNNLKNFSFFESNGEENLSRKFYSISFYNENNDVGEIHYTNSYEYGNMNVINFIRKSNLFFLFTSSVQHAKFFKKIINKMFNKSVSFDILKIPLTTETVKLPNISNFTVIQSDSVFGIVGTLMFESNDYLIKIYSNGLVTFPFTNNKELIKEIINISLEFLKKNGQI